MSAILEYMLKQGNEDIKEVTLREAKRVYSRIYGSENFKVEYIPLMTIVHEKGNVLYTAGKEVEYHSEEEKKLLSQFPHTDDDNVVREWLKALGYTEKEIEEELDEIKNGPQVYRELYEDLGYTSEQIEEEMRKLRAEGKVFYGHTLIPIGYKEEELKGDEIFNHPVFREIYFKIFSIPLLEGVSVERGDELSIVKYNLNTRMSPSECEVVRDFYFGCCKEIGFDLGYCFDKRKKITLNPSKQTSPLIQFFYFGNLSPLEIRVIIPTNSIGVDILDKLENMIGKFDPYEGNFSKEI